MGEREWHIRLLDVARMVGSWSKDPSTKVGCVVVNDDRVVLSTGYNGLPRGVIDDPDRMERPAKYLWTSHAEENAIAQAALVGARLAGATAYVTHRPCARCARSLIQAGVARLVIDASGTTSMPVEEFTVAEMMFDEVGIKRTFVCR